MKTQLSSTGRLLLILLGGFIPLLTFSQQIPNSLRAANGTFIGFYEYKPVDYTTSPTNKYPVIIFLHGIGECGNGTTDLPRVLANAIPKYINAGHPMRFFYNGKWETFLVLSPQLANGMGYWPTVYVEEMIKYAKTNLNVDTNRMYLTGLSLGGGGTWQYASASYSNAKELAAIAPVCGTCNWSNVCGTIASANLPVWAFHAQDDGLVGVGCTTGAIANINACSPAVPPIMSIYPYGNHFIWDRSYDTTHNWHSPNMYEWFLSNSRAGTSPGPNVPPVARAGSDQTVTLPVNAVTLNGTASYDTDGSISAYSWTKIGGPAQHAIVSPAGSTTVINNLAQGVYSFVLTVTDNRGAASKDTVLVNVNGAAPAPNQPPIAMAGPDQTITLPTNNNYLFGSGSYDPDGIITAFTWTQVSGPGSATITVLSASNVNVSNLLQGTYNFRLQVTDNIGATASDTVRITVLAQNVPPVANAGADQAIQLPLNSVSLSGSASSDPDGTITSYAWTKTAGPAQYNIANANTVSPSVTNLAAGTYTFRLVITDSRGESDDDEVVVTVNPAPPPPNIAPSANAGSDRSIQLPTNSVTLNGSASSDPDGTISSYAWTKIAGPAQFNLNNANNVSAGVTNLAQGAYSFRLVVTDNSGASDADTVVITVNAAPPPPNVAPTANAGGDQSIQLPVNTVNVSGAASTDPDGSITAYAWSKISGPSQYNISNAGTVSAAVSNLTTGTYSFRLVVTDNNGATDDDTVIISVAAAPNVAPTANAGGDQSIQLPANSVTLSGAASSDADGSIVSYSWSKVSGPASYNIANASNVNTSVGGLVAGTYSFMLLVTDNAGATGIDTVVVYVGAAPPPPNTAPVANAGSDQSIQLPLSNVSLDASASVDADGTITAYAWSKISGPAQYNIANANGMRPSVTNLTVGTYSFRLVVTDNNGATGYDTVFVTVTAAPPPPNVAPSANAGSDQFIQLPANASTLNGAASSDADGSITAYAWSRISGPSQYNIADPTSVSTSVTNLSAGTYAFRLVVTDNAGASDDDTVLITVTAAPPPPNVPPVANAGSDQSIQLPTGSVTLNGSGSGDIDGTIVAYAWSRISGPAQYNFTNANSVSTTVTNLSAGTYVFRLVVTDNSGATADDTIIITVSAAPPPPNVVPVAQAGNDQSIQLPANVAILDGSASTDSDGSITAYSWSKISGPGQYNIANANNVTTSVNNLAEGTYEFRLVVTDDRGASDDDTITIVVTAAPPPPNQAPVARAGNDVVIHLPTSSSTLDAGASFDPDGTIVAYSWNRVSGPSGLTIVNATTVQADVVGLRAGEYIFELTVTDNKGASASDQIRITVHAQQNLPPLARAGSDTTIAVPASAGWLSGMTSMDPDGSIVNYKWRQITGPTSAIMQQASAPLTTVTSLQQGDYLFELTVEDDDGATAKDSVSISVVNNFRYEETLMIYPNPVQSGAQVRCVSDSTGELSLRIIDAAGRYVKSIRTMKGQTSFEDRINLTELKPGMYYLEAIIGDKKRMLRKFIKQ